MEESDLDLKIGAIFLPRDGDGKITEQEFIRACLEDVELSRLLSTRA